MLGPGNIRDLSLSRLALEASETYRRHLGACSVGACLCSQRMTKGLAMCYFLAWNLLEQRGVDGSLALGLIFVNLEVYLPACLQLAYLPTGNLHLLYSF